MNTDHNTLADNNPGSTEDKQITPEVIAYFRFRALMLAPLRKAAQARIAEERTGEQLPGEYLDRWYE